MIEATRRIQLPDGTYSRRAYTEAEILMINRGAPEAAKARWEKRMRKGAKA